ncbi:hypothetical protein ACP4OV_018758 [Aristida adscensionis]
MLAKEQCGLAFQGPLPTTDTSLWPSSSVASMINTNNPKSRPQHNETQPLLPHSTLTKNPTMAADAEAEPESGADAAEGSTADASDDFEFCILSSGGLAPAGAGAGAGAGTDMCVADELFSHGKLLPLRPSAAAAGDFPGLATTLPRSESAASTVGLGSRSDSRSASSSASSSGSVSRSQSSKGGASDQAAAAAAPPRRSLPSSLFYAHPSPSPQLRSSRPRRSTGSAPPPAAWGILRLGVVGVPDVYPPPRPAETKNAAAAAAAGRGGGGSRSARFELPGSAAADRKLGLGLIGDTLGCRCSPDAVEPVRLPEAARRSGAKDGGAKSGHSARRSRIVEWLQELSPITKHKK